MINIHITEDGIGSQIENETAVEVLTILTVAVLTVCKQLNVSVKKFIAAILDSIQELENEED